MSATMELIISTYLFLFIIAYLLSKKKQEPRRIFLFIWGSLFIAEVVKQLINFFILPQMLPLWLPFHFSSLILYTMPVALFAPRKSTLSSIGWALTATIAFVMFIGFLTAPSTIMGAFTVDYLRGVRTGDWINLFRRLHSYLYHSVASLVFLLLIGLKREKIKLRHLFLGLPFYTAALLIFAIFAYTMNTNFASLLHFPLGSINEIYSQHGLLLYQLVMILGYNSVLIIGGLFFKVVEYASIMSKYGLSFPHCVIIKLKKYL